VWGGEVPPPMQHLQGKCCHKSATKLLASMGESSELQMGWERCERSSEWMWFLWLALPSMLALQQIVLDLSQHSMTYILCTNWTGLSQTLFAKLVQKSFLCCLTFGFWLSYGVVHDFCSTVMGDLIFIITRITDRKCPHI